VRVANVGLGRWGRQLAEAAIKTGSTVGGCYSPSEASRRSFAEWFGCAPAQNLPELLSRPDIDAVLIATPHSTHADIAVAAAEAGKHVLVEKPLALTVDEARRVIAAARQAKVTLQVGHNRRRTAATRRIKQMLDERELGDVLLAEGTTARPIANLPWFTGWREDGAESPLGGMTAVGVHLVDNLHYLLGPVETVFARSNKVLAVGGLDDVTVLVLEFACGALGYIGTSLQIPPAFSMKIHGTAAVAWTEDTRAQKGGTGSKLFLQNVSETGGTELPLTTVNPLVDQFEEFVRCCEQGIEPETGADEGLAVVAVMAAAIESVRSGRAVELSQVL
jgi:predicted dehydrogenase